MPADLNLAGEAETTFNVHVNTTGLASGSTLTTRVIVNAFNSQTGKPTQGSLVLLPVTVNMVSPAMQLSEMGLDFSAALATRWSGQ
ncbi:MAG TPA: hypothetical protein VGF67_31795 [Ktedonobacteraceae bacterium]|jgi:hypothetical protein